MYSENHYLSGGINDLWRMTNSEPQNLFRSPSLTNSVDHSHPLWEAVFSFATKSPRLESAVEVAGRQKHSILSYGALLQRATSEAIALRELGLASGEKSLLLVTPGFSFVSLTLAVIACGAVPVFLDPGMGIKNIRRSIADLQPTFFIGSGRAQLLRLLAKRELCCVRKFVSTAALAFLPATALTKNFPAEKNSLFAPASWQPSAPALVAFTSGATGAPKGVVFTSETLRAQLEIFRNILRPELGTRDLPLLPIFAVYNLALGVSSVFGVTHPTKPLKFETALVLQVLDQLDIRSSFGSPTLWMKIAAAAKEQGKIFPKLSRLCMAGVGVPDRALQETKQLFPNARILTPYGSTEALPVTSLVAGERENAQSASIAYGFGTLVGKPLINVRIVETREPFNVEASVPAGTIGEIIVSGPNVSAEYLNRPEATALSKHIDANHDLWHRMGDLGYFDESGRLYYCGRKVHQVIAGNGIFFSECVENVFNTLPSIRRSALVYFSLTNEAGLAVEIDSGVDTARLTGELQKIGQTHAWTEKITRFEFHRQFPVDARHNAKIFRDRLGN